MFTFVATVVITFLLFGAPYLQSNTGFVTSSTPADSEKIEIGLTMAEVTDILGDNYVQTIAFGQTIWKYEIGKVSEYVLKGTNDWKFDSLIIEHC